MRECREYHIPVAVIRPASAVVLAPNKFAARLELKAGHVEEMRYHNSEREDEANAKPTGKPIDHQESLEVRP